MQNNYYGFPWQQSSQQINYGQMPQAYIDQQPVPHQQVNYDSTNRFSLPPPPPPPPENQSSQPPTPDHIKTQNMNKNVRKQQQNNFNQGFSDNRGQQQHQHQQQQNNSNKNNNNHGNNNKQQNFRGNNRRGGGGNQNQRGNNRFPADNKHQMQQNSNNNFNENQSNQMQQNFGNARGSNKNNRNNRQNWNKGGNNNKNNNRNNNNPGPSHDNNANQSSNLQNTQQQQTNSVPGSGNFEKLREEFNRWEAKYSMWLDEMKDSPELQYYKMQFLEQREEFLSRLEKIKPKPAATVTTPTLTEEQIKFNNEWTAGNSSKEPTQAKPAVTLYDAVSATSTQVLPTSFSSNTDVSASIILFGNMKSNTIETPKMDFAVDDGVDMNMAFKHSIADTSSVFHKNQSVFQSAIPGLGDLNPEKKNVCGKDDEMEVDFDRSIPPPMPKFGLKKSRDVIQIEYILEEPYRSKRTEKILILIRGPPGSGKHYLAEKIKNRENELANDDRCEIVSIRSHIVDGKYDPKQENLYDDLQFEEFKSLLLEGYKNFLIVIINGCGIKQFNRINHHSFGKFWTCYSIEIHQDPKICKNYGLYERELKDITNARDDLIRYSTPIKITLIDPTCLYSQNSQKAIVETKSSEIPTATNFPTREPNKFAGRTANTPKNPSYNEQSDFNLTEMKNPESSQNFTNTNAKNQNFPNTNVKSNTNMQNFTNTNTNTSSSQNFTNLNANKNSQNFTNTNTSSSQNFTNTNTIDSVDNEFAKKFTQMLQNENVMQLLQAHLNDTNKSHQQQQQQPMNQNNRQQQQFHPMMHNFNFQHQHQQPVKSDPFEDCPVFKSSKIVDYNHIHKPTLEESLMEFKVLRTIEYNHRTSSKLNIFIWDIDVDKIIEKRKAIALRRKILEYLRNAERPEDTVSNPKYPRNWEVIQHERPPRKSKRRKRLTPKIKRILLQKMREQKSWMTIGYVREQQQMDLEAISSEDEDMDDEKPVKKARFESQEIVVPTYNDEYKDVVKTTPDFNHFNHRRVANIKSILYYPERKSRPSKILIVMRGPQGSGKSHLVQLIKRKESQMGRASDIRILSIDDYYLTEDDEDQNSPELMRSYLESIQRHLRKTIIDNLHNFIIIDAENCDLMAYNQFYQIGTSMGCAVYTIELFQSVDICLKQCKRLCSKEDIEMSIKMMEIDRIPSDHVLLVPNVLYDEFGCFVNPELSRGDNPDVSGNDSIKNYQNYLVQTINDDYLTLMPQFNWHNREIVDIKEVLDEPSRSKRTKNVAILMRGPGCGKSELAAMILSKEKEYGNENGIFVSIDEFFMDSNGKYQYDSRNVDGNVQKLIRKLLEILRAKGHNFIIVDVETGDFSHYMQIYELLEKQNQCYTIETYQDAAICAENDVHKRSLKDFESILEEMTLNSTPDSHILLDASMFYKHQPVESLDRPLKSALKATGCDLTSPETSQSNDLEKMYEKQFMDLSMHEKFQAKYNQRISINGKFVDRNSSPPANLPEFNWFNVDIVDIKDILEDPGRQSRAGKIAIFIRGPPGSGKTYLSGLIARKEFENKNSENFCLISMDEYFENEKYRETDFVGQYEKYIDSEPDESMVDEYMRQLDENFTNILSENKQNIFIVLDGDYCDLKYYNEMWTKAVASGFKCYVIEMNQDENICIKYNDHKWSDSFVMDRIKSMQNVMSPQDHTLLDPEYLYHEYSYQFNADGDVFGDDVPEVTDDDNETGELSFGKFKMSQSHMSSKWDDYDTQPDIERLDGVRSKSSTKRVTMADYLQTNDDEEWSMRPSVSGKKRVRWADIEEKKAQEHMRKIGFIVGHTDWNRMTDESDGKSALEKTKFIERRQKKL